MKIVLIQFFLLVFILVAVCCLDKNPPYMAHLADDLELSSERSDPSLSRFKHDVFYVPCNVRYQYATLSFLDLFDDYRQRARFMSAAEYVDKLYHSEIHIGSKSCTQMDTVLLKKYENNFNLLYQQTIGFEDKYLRSDLESEYLDIGTLLYLYSVEGYRISFDEERKLIAVEK